MKLHYKGFLAEVKYSAATDSFYGEVTNTKEVIVFVLDQLSDAETTFKAIIEDKILSIPLLFDTASPP